MKTMRALILHNPVSPGASADEADVLVQAEAVSKALLKLGYEPLTEAFYPDLDAFIAIIRRIDPKFVFNLVESVAGTGRLIYIATAFLDFLNIPYTGAGNEAMFLTSNKVIAKAMLAKSGIKTPDWVSLADMKYGGEIPSNGPFILKNVWEEGSWQLDEDSVVSTNDRDTLHRSLESRHAAFGGEWFAEKYIDGREFNLSVIASESGPQVLLPVEMVFDGYPDGKYKVVGFKAKWDSQSFEFSHTVRRFTFSTEDEPLLEEIASISRQCWSLFDLRGYARIDFRVDTSGTPLVIEINANPCISPDAGFVAACERVGIDYPTMIARIVADSFSRKKS